MEFDQNFISLVLIPAGIFLARVADVTIGTVRIIYVSRGMKFQAAMLGFFEVLIWIIVISQILNNLGHPITYIAYAGGFAMGNYIGILIENKLSIGKVIVRIITGENIDELQDFLEDSQIRYTIVDAMGSRGTVKIVFSIIDRKNIKTIMESIRKFAPAAFFSIEDVRQVKEGEFPGSFRFLSAGRPFTRLRPFRAMKRK